MTFSVMITTRNRCADLQRTGERLLKLNPQPFEILVCADGCTDGTVAMLHHNFPSFTIFENALSQGSVPSRDRLLRLAKGDIVVSLDDDSYPVADDFFARLEPIIQAHPEAAVFYLGEVWDGDKFSPAVLRMNGQGYYAAAYANCAAAVRRNVYLQSAGYPVFFEHMYEEPDFSLQCYAMKYAVWMEPAIHVRHHFSVKNRTPIRRHQYHARNELWTVLLRCPMPWLPFIVCFRMFRQFQFALRQGFGWVVREPSWWASALAGVGACFRNRQAVPWRTFYGWMKLGHCQINSHDELVKLFGW